MSPTPSSPIPSLAESRPGAASPPQEAPSAPLESPSSSKLREQLYNRAYDQLQSDTPKLVEAHEKILSYELEGSEIEQNAGKRWVQMEQLVQRSLEKTKKEAATKQAIEDGMEVVYSVKGIVEKTVKAEPQAALVWVGVCLALEVHAPPRSLFPIKNDSVTNNRKILSNPVTQANAHRKGITYVVARMDWYWNLSDLLLDQNRADESFPGLRHQLEKL